MRPMGAENKIDISYSYLIHVTSWIFLYESSKAMFSSKLTDLTAKVLKESVICIVYLPSSHLPEKDYHHYTYHFFIYCLNNTNYICYPNVDWPANVQ